MADGQLHRGGWFGRSEGAGMRPRLLDLLPARIMDRVQTGSDCWTWRGWHNNLGYGYTHWQGRDRPVHRVIMEVLGLVSAEQDIDHLCRNPGCCNPTHLEAVSHRENIKRGRAGTKTACKLGHDWTDPRNVYVRRDGRRWCAECQRTRWSRKKAA